MHETQTKSAPISNKRAIFIKGKLGEIIFSYTQCYQLSDMKSLLQYILTKEESFLKLIIDNDLWKHLRQASKHQRTHSLPDLQGLKERAYDVSNLSSRLLHICFKLDCL